MGDGLPPTAGIPPRPGYPATPEAALRSARRIAFALVAGCLLFAGIVVFLGSRRTASDFAESTRSTLGLFGWAVAIGNLLLSFVLRGRPPKDPARRSAHLLQRATVSLALNEGSVLLNLSLALATGSLVPGLYAAGIGFAGLVLHFPTRSRFGLEP